MRPYIHFEYGTEEKVFEIDIFDEVRKFNTEHHVILENSQKGSGKQMINMDVCQVHL